MYTFPAITVGDPEIRPPARKRHCTSPVAASIERRSPEYEPTSTRFSQIAGDEYTYPPVERDHRRSPVVAPKAYILPSVEPMNTRP